MSTRLKKFFEVPSDLEANRMVILLRRVLYLVVIFLFLKHSFFGVWSYVGMDYNLFYQAAKDIWSGVSPYEYTFIEGVDLDVDPFGSRPWGHYIYPTPYACYLIPFLVMPVFWAKKLYVILSMAAYIGAFLVLRKICNLKAKGPWTQLCITALWLLWAPAIDTLRHGQANSLVFVLLFASWYCLRERKELCAAILLGLACTVKLTPLAILPLFIVTFRPRIALIALATFAGVCILAYPSYNWIYFTKVLPEMGSVTQPADLVSIQGVASYWIERWGWTGHAWATLLSVVLYLAFLARLFFRRHKFQPEGTLLAGILAMPLFTGVYGHHYMVVVLPIVWALVRVIEPRGDRRPNWWLFAIMLVLLIPGFQQHLMAAREIVRILNTVVPLESVYPFVVGLLLFGLICLWKGLFTEEPTPGKMVVQSKLKPSEC